MTDKIWIQSYPPGVPAFVDSSCYQSIHEIFAEAICKFDDKTAFSCMGTSISYAQLDSLARDFAAYLQSLPGMKKGDRVALMLPNLLQYPVAMLGAMRAGFVLVNLNPLSTSVELEYQLRDSGAKVIVVFENVAHILQQAMKNAPVEHVVLASMGEMHGFFKRMLFNLSLPYTQRRVPAFSIPGAIFFNKALKQGRSKQFADMNVIPEDLAFIQYTGSGQGQSKGAMLTHGNVVANFQQVSSGLMLGIKEVIEEGGAISVTQLPMHQILCLTANVLIFISAGGHCLLIPESSNTKAFVKTLASLPFAAMIADGAIFNDLLNAPAFNQLDFSHFKFAICGGEVIDPEVAEHWKKVTAVCVSEFYGLTEASHVVCINPDKVQPKGAVGLPVPSTDIRIRDIHLNELPMGHEGELYIKGPQVMRGYWNKPRQTAELLVGDGWLKTGDIGYINQAGCVYITCRKKP